METLEQYKQRVGHPVELAIGRRLGTPFPPANDVTYLEAEDPEQVAIRDLGCRRRSTYRELGRGATVSLRGDATGASGRSQRVQSDGPGV